MKLWQDLREKLILKFFVYELKRRKRRSVQNVGFIPPPVSLEEREFRGLVENAQDVVWKWDIKLGCTYVSPNIYEHLGLLPEEVLGKTPSDFVAPEDAANLMKAILTSLERGQGVKNFQCNLVHKDGRHITTEASTTPIYDEKGDITGFYGINRDVTERKKAKDLSDALNDINSAINSTLNYEDVMQRVADESLNAIEFDLCMILLNDENKWLIKYHSGNIERSVDEFVKKYYQKFEQLSPKEPLYINTEQETEIAASLASEIGTGTILLAPLSVKGVFAGAITFICYDKILNPADYDIDFLKKLCASISMSLENSKLFAEQKAISDTLQESLLSIPKSMEGIEFSFEYASATEYSRVGGDFIDIFELNKDAIGIIVGDISGNGLLAANLTTLVKNSIKAYAFYEESPAAVLKKTNTAVLAARQIQMFATVFYAVLKPSTGEITYCCAGHPPPILKRKTLHTVQIEPNSPSVGAFGSATYNNNSISIDKGDVLLIYTDGITEARHREDFFGEKRLIRIIRDLTTVDVKEMPKLIFNKVLDYTGGKTSDDIAILALSLSGDQPPS